MQEVQHIIADTEASISDVSSADKDPGTYIACKRQGHLATKSDSEVAGGIDIPVMYCRCGRGPCNILTSKTDKHPNRMFYTCPMQPHNEKKDCNFFMWVDELKAKAPQCPCGAGACSIQTVTNGHNKGKQFFACRIKKGHGACNFCQWIDSQATVQANRLSGQNNLSKTLGTSASSQISSNCTSFASYPTLSILASSHATADVIDFHNGGTLLDIQPSRLPNAENSEHPSDCFLVAGGPKCDNVPGILAQKDLDPPEVVVPENVSSTRDNLTTEQSGGTESFDLLMRKGIYNGLLETKAKMYGQKAFSHTSNLHASMPSTSSSRLRSSSRPCGGCSQLLESQASISPEYPGHYGYMHHGLTNQGQYTCMSGMPYGVMERIEQLNRENGELKNEIKNLKEQVAAYVKKDDMKGREMQVRNLLEMVVESIKEILYKLCLIVLVLAVLLMYLQK